MAPYLLALILVAYVKGDMGSNVDTRIVGGKKAPNGAFPWQVSLRNISSGNSHFCGGSIIDKKWILTAAKCTFGVDASSIAVFVGTNKLSSGGKSFEIETIKIHEKYNPENQLNDISLIKLKKVIEYTAQITAIQPAIKYQAGRAIFSGWGSDEKKRVRDDLQMLELIVLKPNECKNKLRSYYDTTRLCGVTKSGQGFCNGDEGGALVKGRQQIGIASLSVKCGNKFPNIYTKVPSFIPWIRENTRN